MCLNLFFPEPESTRAALQTQSPWATNLATGPIALYLPRLAERARGFLDWKGTPVLNLISRGGQLMSLSLFDSANYNACIAAQSGSGKSFLINELISTTLSVGGRCWVIDVGRSYEKLCEALDGQFLSFTRVEMGIGEPLIPARRGWSHPGRCGNYGRPWPGTDCAVGGDPRRLSRWSRAAAVRRPELPPAAWLGRSAHRCCWPGVARSRWP